MTELTIMVGAYCVLIWCWRRFARVTTGGFR